MDYKGKMWGSHCEPIMCYWDDVWDSASWKLGSDGRKSRALWFGIRYDEKREEGSATGENDTKEDTSSLLAS